MKAIYSRRCWLDNKLQQATVYHYDGVITQIRKGNPENFENIEDVGEYVLMPGVIDAHVHVNEPGRTDWEGFDTATKAAAAGGTTTFVDMPLNASPVTTTLKALKEKLAATEGKLHVNCGFYGGLIPESQNELEELIQSGVLGIKAFLIHSGIDEFPNVGEKELDEAMPIIAKNNLPLLVHCELNDQNTNNDLLFHPTSYQSYLASRPKSWENEAIELMINLCERHHCNTHIVHVSSAEALAQIKEAKETGLQLTAETCPHYIFFNAEEIRDASTIYKCAPPIREKINNDLLKHALNEGVLNFIASDHSPAPPAIKEIETGNLQKAWGGIAGLQFLLPAAWSSLKDMMSLEKFIPLLTEKPAQFLQVDKQKGFIKEGYDADFSIWSPEENFVVKKESILHKHKISPYVSQQLSGFVHQTIVNGISVYEDGKIIETKTKPGKLLLSSKPS
ncbi:MAG: allantoinase AllB [Chitinophagaceae bacterium]